MEKIKTKTSIFRVLFALFALMILPCNVICQSCYSPFIDSIVSQVSLQSITNYNLELTGEVPTVIGGQPYRITSRFWQNPSNQKAAQYIFEKFQSYGLETRYQTYSSTGVNVIAKKTGVKFPNKQFIICAHYDNILINPPFSDTVYGADDNASGTCAVLEAARILSNYNLDYTVIFAAWDEEEIGLIGSTNYADTAFLHQDSIMCVFNLDVIGYDPYNNNVYRVLTDTASAYYAGVFSTSGYSYQPQLISRIVFGWGGSDHVSFQQKGFNAVCGIENSPGNPYMHTIYDRFNRLNLPFFEGLVKTSIAALIVVSDDYVINIQHEALQSTYDTTARVVTAVITSNHPIARNDISKNPRLYWKAGTSSFNFRNAFYSNLDTFKFLIPGQAAGSTVSYYLSAQDSLGTMVGSLPGGARGVNPPGVIPPPEVFTYAILSELNICSNTVPKPVPPGQIILDTIHISQTGTVQDFNLNLTIYHTNDSNLFIWLTRPGQQVNKLSTSNGGDGDNYINTTFDDEALTPITQGSPPFTGSFRPEQSLSYFDNSQMQGDWIIRIYNNSSTVTGTLAGWCLSFDYFNPIGIENTQIPERSSLLQNYPNPFNPTTTIKYELPNDGMITFKIYDILGQEIYSINEFRKAGIHEIKFDGSAYASGAYFYRIEAGDYMATKKMVLIK